MKWAEEGALDFEVIPDPGAFFIFVFRTETGRTVGLVFWLDPPTED